MPKSSDKGNKGKKPKSRLVLVDSKSSSPKPLSKRPPKVTGLVRKDAALRRLGVKKEDLDLSPQITDILKSSFKNVKAAIQAIRFSNETPAIEFLSVYDNIPAGDRDYIPIEAVCLKASVSPSALLGATFLACKMMRGQESALIAVNAHPDVLKATIRFAKLPGGDRHAKIIHEAVGFLPTPKGGSINVNLLNGVPQHQKPERASEPVEEEDFGSLFPNINRNLEKWSSDRRKLLSDGN